MPSQFSIKNASQLNTLRVSFQDGEPDVDQKTQKPNGKSRWKPSPAVSGLIPPGKFLDVWVDAGRRRAVVEEIAT